MIFVKYRILYIEMSSIYGNYKQSSYQQNATFFRLSQIAGNKLKHNNADIADLSDRNRPTCLAEKFSELYDNEWTDAYDHVNKSCDQESTIAHLVDLLQVTLDQIKYTHEQ